MPHHHHFHRRQRGGDDNSHQPSNHENRDAKPDPQSPKVATVVSVVYVTASQTFSGPVGGYTTLAPVVGPPLQQTSQPSPSPLAAAPSSIASPEPLSSSTPSRAPVIPQSETTSSAEPSSIAPSSTPSSVPSSVEETASSDTSSASPTSTTPLTGSIGTTASSTLSSTSPDVVSSPSFTTTSATSSPSGTAIAKSNTTGSGMSGGAKAGMVLGLLLGLGAIFALVLFCYRRKKNHNRSYEKTDDERTDNEKTTFNDNAMAIGAGRPPSAGTTRTSATAPRLSLRPLTQFSPDLGGKRRSGNLLAATSTPAAAAPQGAHTNSSVAELPSGSGRQGELVQGSPGNSCNPFADHAETSAPAPQAMGSPPAAALPQATQAVAPLAIPNPTPKGLGIDAGAVAGALPSYQHVPKPLSISPNHAATTAPVPSPAGTEFSMASTTVDTPAGVAPHVSNVHRVQLDFRPSMEDELELRAGQLVRLLHEYDDGWALCIRLDRSQQGVAPRTCLSTRPVKPRPAGAGHPRGPGQLSMRGPPIQPMPGAGAPRPMAPASGRNSPGPSTHNQSPRAMSPGPFAKQPRSMSPGDGGGPQRPTPPPGGRSRSDSASQVRERRNSPPGPSPMNPNAKGPQRLPTQLVAGSPQPQTSLSGSMPRKPVPGQAI